MLGNTKLNVVNREVPEQQHYPSQERISVYRYDITDRKQMESSFQDPASIVDNSANAIYSTDLKGQIMRWNPSAQRIFGYSFDEVKGKSASLLYPSDMTSQYDVILKMINYSEYIIQFETRHIKKNGLFVDVLVATSPILNEKSVVIGISYFNQDISERKRLEKEMLRLDRLNFVGEMAAGIAHEIRNPMTTVRGFLQLLKSNRKFLMEREIFDLMIGEIDKADSIISKFLLLAKNRVVRLTLHNLNSLIETVFLMLHAEAVLHAVYVKLDLKDVPDILIDESEIRQLLINLVRNGFEAMSPGGSLTISTYIDLRELVLSVKDNGQGMLPDILKNLGTPFITTKKNGAGLGLATCFSIAERHEARIDVESGSEGTTVCVRFRI